MLLQVPLLFAYVRVLQNAAELRRYASWFWLADLSMPDPLHILPTMIIRSMSFVQFITPTPTIDPTQRRILAIIMPLVMGFALWRYASGLALYWATCNLFNLVLQIAANSAGKCAPLSQNVPAQRKDAVAIDDSVVAMARNGDPGMIRTCDKQFRKLLLYPPELRGHV